MDKKLKGTTLIVGAVSSIGGEIVKSIEELAENLVLTWHNRKPENSKHEVVQVDLSEFKDIEKLTSILGNVEPKWQNLIFVAGDYWADKGRDFEGEEDWEKATKIFQVNSIAFTLLVRKLFTILEDANLNGKVVAISSTSGDHGVTNAPLYAASKSALNRLVKDASARFGKRVSTSAVAPGPVDTPMLVGTSKGKDEYILETPSGRLSTAAEIAAAVIFLLENPQTSGAIIQVDGGRIVS